MKTLNAVENSPCKGNMSHLVSRLHETVKNFSPTESSKKEKKEFISNM